MISGVFNVTYYMYQYSGWFNSTQTIEFFWKTKRQTEKNLYENNKLLLQPSLKKYDPCTILSIIHFGQCRE